MSETPGHDAWADSGDLAFSESFSKPAEEEDDLFREELNRFEAVLEETKGEKNLETAMRRYGFSLFHSLSLEKQTELMLTLGLETASVIDVYNAACVRAAAGDLAASVTLFAKALEMRPEFPEAVYNLALAYEKQGNAKQAHAFWEKYLASAAHEDDKEAVRKHVSQQAA